MMRTLFLAAAVASLLAATPAMAQPRLRALEVPVTAAWKHANTDLTLGPTLDGLTRKRIEDAGSEELDLLATYESADRTLLGTIYIFRPQVPNVPLWFDRARLTLERSKHLPVDSGGATPVRSFALRGTGTSDSLRAAYPLTGGEYKSTALAVMPMNGWILKVRMSSKSLGAAELDSRLATFISALRLPQLRAAPAAAPIADCARPLGFRTAKMLKPDAAQTVLGSLMTVAAADKAPATDVSYCRDPHQDMMSGIYRAGGSSDSYLLALGDAGRVASIRPALPLGRKAEPSYSVTLLDLGASRLYPSFDRLPGPDQVLGILQRSRPLSVTKVGSNTITIGVDPSAER